MDEMGHQPWADALETICFVSTECTAKMVRSPVSRQGKRVTLIACIAADGSYARLAVVIPRKTYDDDLCMSGLRKEKLDAHYQGKGRSLIECPLEECKMRAMTA
jgi:hypothetical protein